MSTSTRRAFFKTTAAGITAAASAGAVRSMAADTTADQKFPHAFGSVCQLAYVVEDIHRAMTGLTKSLKAGPWFLTEKMQQSMSYRGKPVVFHGNWAFGNTGRTMIELIQQTDDAASIYTEIVRSKGYGLHHQGIGVKDYDAQMKSYRALGYEPVCESGTAPNRAAYVDTKGDMPCFVEVMEVSEEIERTFIATYQATIGWDGKDPVRPSKKW